MPQIGFVEALTGRAVVVTAWGGDGKGSDGQWQDAWASYLVDRCLSDNFVW
jgi:hypothetical protein